MNKQELKALDNRAKSLSTELSIYLELAVEGFHLNKDDLQDIKSIMSEYQEVIDKLLAIFK